MFRVLIVDDEQIVKYGIKSMIDWEKIGLSVVGDAGNGKEALELFEKWQPEIVITDIKMPVMDGIELIREIRALNAQTKIIILSCLQEFEYAKEAIRLGASDYLIKSDMMPADLEEVLRKVRTSIVSELAATERINHMAEKFLFTEAIAKEKLLWELSLGTVSNRAMLNEYLRLLDIDTFQNRLFVLNIGIDYYEKLISEKSEPERAAMLGALTEAVKEETALADENCRCEVYTGNTGELNVLVKIVQAPAETSDSDAVQLLANRIIGRAARSGFSVSVGISDRFDRLQEIKKAYDQAHQAYRNKLFFGCGKAIPFYRIDRPRAAKREGHVRYQKLRDAVYSLKRVELAAYLDELFETERASEDLDSIHQTSLELVMNLNTIYAEIGKDNEENAKRKKEYYEQIKYLETLADIKEWFKAAYARLTDEMERVYNSDRNVIAKAVHYIQTHYREGISLAAISSHVHLSKNYFANLFKKETGEGFVEYVTKFRVEKAKALLKNADLKAVEVGPMVGFSDPKYFSKVFKKTTGMTPSEFKDRNR